MLVVGFLIVLLSVLGLPWYVAATVSALAHVMSLRKESECTALLVLYSQTFIKRSPLGQRKNDLIRQVTP
jgi:hypothetical protein